MGAPGNLPVANAWFQFYWIRNELVNPSVLVDPSDKRAVVAAAWENVPGGLRHNSYKDNAVSYVLGVDGGVIRDPSSGNYTYLWEQAQNHLLLACRNMTSNTYPATCSSGIQNLAGVNNPRPNLPNIKWGNDIHGAGSGNVAKLDGSVEKVTDRGLCEAMALADDVGASHWLYPRQ
jgi:prepilin-type processing-associated H-X9-DG protein